MESKIPAWITNFLYSIGTLDEIKRGTCKRTLIKPEQDYTKKLSQNAGVILVPKLIGIYQTREPASETPKKKKERGEVGEKMGELDDKFLEGVWRIRDNINPQLIHIGYNPEIWPLDILQISLNDGLRRVKISPIDSLPNFFQKDNITLYEIVEENATLLGDDESKLSREENRAINRRFIPQVKKLEEELKPFGLTRDEWVNINLYFLDI